METAAAVEIEQGAFGDIYLDDFPRCLENPCWVFHSYHKPDGV